MRLVRSGDTQFAFVDGDCTTAIRIASIGVVQIGRPEVIWWIVSDEYSEVWMPSERVPLLEIQGEEAAHALRRFRSFPEKSNGSLLSRIRYGVVPNGFHQITPEEGPPPALVRRRRYVLHLFGGDMAELEFVY